MKYEIGQEVPISCIVKITGANEKKGGSIVYNTNREFAIREQILEQIEIKPYIKTEPTQPTQPEQEDKPKYAIGDKVKVICVEDSWRKNNIGKICEVKSINPNLDINPNMETHYGVGLSCVYFENELEPYTEPEKEPEPEFITGRLNVLTMVVVGT